MRFAYFLLAENRNPKERAELDELLAADRTATTPSKMLRLGGDVKSARRKQ